MRTSQASLSPSVYARFRLAPYVLYGGAIEDGNKDIMTRGRGVDPHIGSNHMGIDESVVPRRNTAGGSAGAGGYNYQALAIVFAEIHILVEQRLNWIEHSVADIPVAVAVETGGPGDDFQIKLDDGTTI